jgi:flagellar biogenesis protein FliO
MLRLAAMTATLCCGSAVRAADPEARLVPMVGTAAPEHGAAWLVPLAVCAVAALLVLWSVGRRARRARARPGSAIEVIDRAAMGRGRALSLVRVGDRVVLVGESGQGFQRLAEFDASESPDLVSVRRLAS